MCGQGKAREFWPEPNIVEREKLVAQLKTLGFDEMQRAWSNSLPLLGLKYIPYLHHPKWNFPQRLKPYLPKLKSRKEKF